MEECKEDCKICRIPQQPLPAWGALLGDEMGEAYFARILERLHAAPFYPPPESVLRCLTFFEVADTRVVILGQDPYHGDGQAMGLAFSVPPALAPPPSLINIKKEILRSTGAASVCKKGCLVEWAKQGVLLLNTTLTVQRKMPRSHVSFGWQRFTDAVIRAVSEKTRNTVFILWGSDAQQKRGLIDQSKHCILKSVHPSPLSASRGFFGCDHFRLANEYLEKHGRGKINW